MNEVYINANFSKKMIANVKQIGQMGDKKFIHVPPGDAKNHDNFPSNLRKGPKINYRQKEGEHTCMVFFLLVLCIILEKSSMSLIFSISTRQLWIIKMLLDAFQK